MSSADPTMDVLCAGFFRSSPVATEAGAEAEAEAEAEADAESGAEVVTRKSDFESQTSEVGCGKSDDGSRNSEVGTLKA